jgi:anti-sigma B factor antagonist
MSLTITSEAGDGFVTIRPSGPLDSQTYTALSEHVVGLIKHKPRVVVFDLRDVHYIGSAGVRVIRWTQKTLRKAGGDIAVINLQPMVRKVLEIIMALSALNVMESAAELDRYLAGGRPKALGQDKA